MHSYAGGRRVFVLGDVDFTREAANALLKFFEEPPAGVVLLIVTTNAPARLLATIRSRLVEVTFPLLTEREVRRVLKRNGVEPDAARNARRSRGGSARARALQYLEDERSIARRRVDVVLRNARGRRTADSAWATRPDARDRARDGQDADARLARAAHRGRGRCRCSRADQRAALGGLAGARPVADLLRALGAIGDARTLARHQRLAGARSRTTRGWPS